jgi:hypothetical protein
LSLSCFANFSSKYHQIIAVFLSFTLSYCLNCFSYELEYAYLGVFMGLKKVLNEKYCACATEIRLSLEKDLKFF